jgi:adenylate kinase
MIMERIKGRALKEGRADDASEEIINTRIVTYHNQTEPLIAYYEEAGKYHEIDGTGSIEEVRDRIFDVMDRL